MGKSMGRDWPHWATAFLERYSTEGGIQLCAKEAGTTWQTVKAYANENPEFAEKVEEARQEFFERLERQMFAMGKGGQKGGSFMAIIARLKGENPAKYNDKLQVSGVVGHVHAGPPQAEIEALLKEMVAAARPTTRAQITGEVLDGTPPPQA